MFLRVRCFSNRSVDCAYEYGVLFRHWEFMFYMTVVSVQCDVVICGFRGCWNVNQPCELNDLCHNFGKPFYINIFEQNNNVNENMWDYIPWYLCNQLHRIIYLFLSWAFALYTSRVRSRNFHIQMCAYFSMTNLEYERNSDRIPSNFFKVERCTRKIRQNFPLSGLKKWSAN
jgi:hypothetical protein